MEKILDDERIDELRTAYESISPAELQELFSEFHADITSGIAKMNDAVAAGKLSDLKGLAHKYKGGALNLGAYALATATKALEAAASQGNQPEIVQLLKQLPDIATATATAHKALTS